MNEVCDGIINTSFDPVANFISPRNATIRNLETSADMSHTVLY